uniref:Anaredoxin n=1 Tax=Anthurium amnicola TaxID=1678845 RepID=A0A1D1Z033_9ARAE
MAKFTAQGGFKLSFSGERACDPRDSSHCRLSGGAGGGVRLFKNPFETHKRSSSSRKNRLARWSSGVSFVGRRSSSFSEEESLNDAVDEDDDYEEFERDELSCFRGLVLDISYRPVNIVCWRRAICLEFMEKADVLEYYDQTVSSPRGSFYIPAVLRVPHLLQVVRRRRVKYNLSRKSIFHRDSYTCQYCSSRENLTIDHVVPVSKGGEWKWENLVTACARCNSRKGQKTLEQVNMKLIKIPKAPKDYDILAIPLTTAALKMLKSRKSVPDEWLQYLSKPAP